MPLDPASFELPIEFFIQTLLKERFPGLSVGEGSAINRALVKPAAAIFSIPWNAVTVMRRNQSIVNAPVMLDEELDDLAANRNVERGQGALAGGSVRVYFDNVQNVIVPASSSFADDEGHTFLPTAAVNVTAAALQSQQDNDTGEYFIDVQVIATALGSEYNLAANAITTLSGIVGASRAANTSRFFGGADPQSNQQLVDAVAVSVTDQELVKKPGIESRLRAEFPDKIRAVQVVGFGDAAMQRDVVSALVGFDMLFGRSFAQKYNVPLGPDGTIDFSNPTAPTGGFVAAVADIVGLDYFDLSVTMDGQLFEPAVVHPGMRVRLFQKTGASPDPDVGDYTIRRVVTASPTEDGEAVPLLLLDRPFIEPDLVTFDPVTEVDSHGYTILGAANTNTFHVGGKVDVYVDTVSDEERSVVVSSLFPVDGSTTVFEVPLTEAIPAAPDGSPLFENSTGFAQPVISVVRVEQIALDNDQVVERTLVLGTNYTVIRASSRSRWTAASSDVMRLTDDQTGESLLGQRIRITYVTNADFSAITDFVDSEAVANVTGDLTIVPPKVRTLDVQFSFKGVPTQSEVSDAVTRFIETRSFEGTVTAFDVASHLTLIGVTDVVGTITLISTKLEDNGERTVESSTDRLSTGQAEKFIPASPLTITKVG